MSTVPYGFGLREFARKWDTQALRLARALQACAAWAACIEHCYGEDIPREVVKRLAAERRALQQTLYAVGLGMGSLILEGVVYDLREPGAWHLGHLIEQEHVRWRRGREQRARTKK